MKARDSELVEVEPEGGLFSRILRFVVGVVTDNLGMKAVALLLALVVFIVTRDEVTRTFTIPLRVIDDPERVLLAAPPETVELQVRGPWVNVNQLGAAEIGSATLDLREVRPGPMEIDPASVVMPRGVVLDRLDYVPVDLRFEALVERSLRIEPALRGDVDSDYLLAGTRVEPDSVVVRGPASVLDALEQLETEVVDVGGIDEAFERQIALGPVPDRLRVLGVEAGEAPALLLVVELIPLIGEREIDVATGAALREALGEDREVPELERVSVRGPRGLLRALEQIDTPLLAEITVEDRELAKWVTLRFGWAGTLDPELTEQLSIVPPLIRLSFAQAVDDDDDAR